MTSALTDWLLAVRPKTLVAAVIPVALGTAVAFRSGRVDLASAVCALAAALLIQVGTNLTNDYFDFVRGADGADRVGPIRVTQSGAIPPRAVLVGALSAFGLAALVGLYLTSVGGWPIALIGILSILSGYAYTGGPFPLGYHGLGDLFVLVFFGPVAVAGTTYLQTHLLTAGAVACGIAIGSLSVALLTVNNLRDAETDARAGKRTLIVRLGTSAGRAEYVGAVILAFLVPCALWALDWAPPSVLLSLLALPLAVGPTRLVLRSSGRALNAALGGTARLLGAFGMLLCVGLVVGSR